MKTLLDVFSQPPSVAGSDTSRAAADSMKAKAPLDRDRVLRAIASSPTGMTCDEVEVALGMRHQSASARVHELVKSYNAIVDSGERRKTRSGRRAVVYVKA